ncbi:hypothetical protein ACFORH_39065 [Amycolatopsis roodepoortensis]|uniref:Uncharacterized protein n=1 Tax=Amycolatopsis roodepoortensis TaxID=700274 RepID=A0ABR9LIJ3_9PSEU|nr:hypothetical protein [Amycolatopsis roodepoortensis]MBE1580516.1 hypothetical protein [Amycolatopsis roodepoortensis]
MSEAGVPDVVDGAAACEGELWLTRVATQMAERARMSAAGSPEASGWRYPGPAALLAAEGRLFTPAVTPVPDERLGKTGECWFNASVFADDHPGAVYVEGWAMAVTGWEEKHAWCGVGETAIEPTAGWAGATVYLGIPFSAEFRRRLYERYGVGSILWEVEVSREYFREGFPPGAIVAGVGRGLPPV